MKGRRRGWGKLRILPSRRYQASYVGPDGLRYTAPRTFFTKQDAEGWLARESRLVALDVWTSPPERESAGKAKTITVGEFAERWLAEREISPKTHALYRALLDSRILPTLGTRAVADVTPAEVRTWWAGLGRATPTRNAHAYNLLKSIMNTAVVDRVRVDNPCQVSGAGKAPKARDVELLTLPELERVTACFPQHYRAAVPVTAWCGLRFGELIELRRKDIADDGTRMVLKIRRAATRVDNELVIGPPKSDAGVRDVHVPPHIAEILRDHLRLLVGRGPDNFVFTTTRGQRLSTTAFTKQFKAACSQVGKPNLRVHDLRHIGAVLAAQAGATTKELMSRLGHTTPAMAMRYQHAAAERDALIAQRLSALAQGNL